MFQFVYVHLVCVCLLMVPPIALGEWSTALVLWLPTENYDYYYYRENLFSHFITVLCTY